MRLGKAPGYAILATIDIARNQRGGPVQGRLIAEHYGIPAEYLLKILQLLVRAKILESETGRRGGFRLRRDPDDVSVLDLLEAVEGPFEGVANFGVQVNDGHPLNVTIGGVCREISNFARDRWRQISVAQLALIAPARVRQMVG